MPKVLIVTGDAAETLEVFYPYQRLLEAGYEVDIAAPSAKKLQFVVHDFVEGFDTYTEKLGHTWQADVAFADVDPATMSRWSSRADGHRNSSATTRNVCASSVTSTESPSR